MRLLPLSVALVLLAGLASATSKDSVGASGVKTRVQLLVSDVAEPSSNSTVEEVKEVTNASASAKESVGASGGKTRVQLLVSDVAEPSSSNSTAEEVKEVTKEQELTTTNSTSVESDAVENLEKDPAVAPEGSKPEDTSMATFPKPVSYITRIKSFIWRMLEYVGIARQKRKGRMMNFSGADNSLETMEYSDEVRATVGSVLGKKDCLKRAACGAGAYLKEVKGKELLIMLMEKVAPSTWAETMDHVKEAAIYHDQCNYDCLDN